MSLNISIIGAGSVYTAEIIEGISENNTKLPVTQLTLMDINEEKLTVMSDFIERFQKKHNLDFKLVKTTNLIDAIEDQDFIMTQIRVGGNEARVNDEKIPLKYGIIGQETTGPGGFMNALRTIPDILEIAKMTEKHNPDAWIINYSNPTGILAEAVLKHTNTKFIALCAGGMRPRLWVEEALGVNYKDVKYDFVGLNHMNFAYNIRINGQKITKEEFDKIADIHHTVSPKLIKAIGALPSQYCQYYFHREKKFNELKNEKRTRGEVVLELEQEIYEAISNSDQEEKPDPLVKRGGGGYGEVALEAVSSIYNDEDMWIVANVKNKRAIEFLPYDVSVETPCVLNKNGITPLVQNDIPSSIYGLVSEVTNYETLTVEAAVEGSYDKALLALIAHPLVGDYDIAVPLLNDLLLANQQFLNPKLLKGISK